MPKISALPPNTNPDGNDEVPGVDESAGSTIKWTLMTIKTWLQGLVGWISTAMLANEAVTPAKRSGGFKIGTIAAADLGSTGNLAVTGVGFKPELVEFYLVYNSTAAIRFLYGSMTASSQTVHTHSTGAGDSYSVKCAEDRCFGWINAGSSSWNLSASFVSMDSDGFTVNVQDAASNFDIRYVAHG